MSDGQVLIDLTADYSDNEVVCLGMTQSDDSENREFKMAVITPDPVN